MPFPSPMMKVKSESEVTQSCPTLSDPMDCSLPGSSVRGICQARVLEWSPSPSPHCCLQAFSSCSEQGLLSGCGAQTSHCSGFYCCGAPAPEPRLGGCGTQAELLCGMWDLPRPGIEPVSPTLTGRFFFVFKIIQIVFFPLFLTFFFNWRKFAL